LVVSRILDWMVKILHRLVVTNPADWSAAVTVVQIAGMPSQPAPKLKRVVVIRGHPARRAWDTRVSTSRWMPSGLSSPATIQKRMPELEMPSDSPGTG
jgi:hypothetical protein